MKISPLSSTGMTVGSITAGAADPGVPTPQVRSLRMATNATPGFDGSAAQELPQDINNEAAPEAEATKPLSPQLAALAKQRRALQVKERELADREKALTERTSTPDGGFDKSRFKSEWLRMAMDSGMTFEDMAKDVAAYQSGNTPDIYALKKQIADLEAGFDKKLTEREAQQEQQALTEMRREALQLVTQGDDYALVRETRSVPKAMDLIERTYRKTGEVLDVREALGLIEGELIKDSLRLAKLQKVQSQLAPAAPLPQQRRPMTLTNRDTASVSLSRKARALAAFSNNLKR